MKEKYLLVEEVAKETRTCVGTVRSWIKAGKLQSVRIGRRWLVPRSELDSLLMNPTLADANRAEGAGA